MELDEELTLITKRLYLDLDHLDHLKSQRSNAQIPDIVRIRLESRITSLEDCIKELQERREEIVKGLKDA